MEYDLFLRKASKTGINFRNSLKLCKPRTEFASGKGLPCEKKAFYSPEIQHGRPVIKVNW